MNEQLKSCPFCGGKAVVIKSTSKTSTVPPSFIENNKPCKLCGTKEDYITYDYIVKCINIECNPNGLRATKLEAIKAWNRRKGN